MRYPGYKGQLRLLVASRVAIAVDVAVPAATVRIHIAIAVRISAQAGNATAEEGRVICTIRTSKSI